MKSLFLIISYFLLPSGDLQTTAHSAVRGQQRVSLQLAVRPFRSKGRAIGVRTKTHEGEAFRFTSIDGRKAWGPDAGSLPHTETVGFTLRLNGNRIAINRDVFSDLFDLSIGLPEYREVEMVPEISVTADGNKIWVKLSGSDGGGGYCVVLVIRRNGEVKRSFYQDGHKTADVTPPKRR